MPYKKNSKLLALLRALIVASVVIMAIAMVSIACNAQTVERLELVLAPPTSIGNPALGYYEVRGNVYDKGTAFDCMDAAPAKSKRVGTYRLGISYGNSAEHAATYLVRLNDGRNLFWQGYFKFDPNEDGSEFSWPYEGIVLHQTGTILTDFTPLSRECFGGKLIIYFLNNGG